MRFSIKTCILLILILTGLTTAQDENIRGVVKSPNGILIVWNQPSNNFTLQVKGNDVEPVENRNLAFLIDGKFLQVVTAFKKDFLSDKQKKEDLDDKSILAAHFIWESSYLEQVVGEKLDIISETISLPNNKAAILWSFRTPEKDKGEVLRQVFLTTVNGESVLALNGAVTSSVGESTVRDFLLATAATLSVRDKPLTQKEAKELASKMN